MYQKFFLFLISLLIIIFFIACPGVDDNGNPTPTPTSAGGNPTPTPTSAGPEITSYCFLAANNPELEQDVCGTILGTNISITVPTGTNVSALVATFDSNGMVDVNGTPQVSGETPNDFSMAVVYQVVDDNFNVAYYTVTVSFVSAEKDITSFSFLATNNAALEIDFVCDIGGTNITVTMPYGIDITDLVATYTTTGSSVTISGVVQTSGTTVNNFSTALTYRVTAADTSIQDYTVTVSEGIVLVQVPGMGSFSMGYAGVDEPVHTVSSISPFKMGKFEVTYGEWTTVKTWAESNGYTFANAGMKGNDGTGATGSSLEPVTSINWRDAIIWCNALSQMEGLTPYYYTDAGQTTVYKNASDTTSEIATTSPTNTNACVNWSGATGYRLSTEAEWEMAARYQDGTNWTAGDAVSGSNLDSMSNCIWYSANATSTHPVGQKTANSLGILDMSGNVIELCWDWWDDYLGSSPYTDDDTRGPDVPDGTIIRKCMRGGSYALNWSYGSTSNRANIDINTVYTDTGFRVVKQN